MLSAGGRVLYMYTTAMADLVGFSLVLLCGVFLPVRHALPSRGTYGTLSLAGSSSSGMVRIFIEGYAGGGSWGAVCYHDGFGMTEATVVCHQLGYTSASSYSSGLRGTDRAVLQDVDCSTDSFLTLLQCSHKSTIDRTFDIGKCTHVVYVTCFTTRIWDNPFEGQIRITGGSYSNRGLLEVYCNGQWGTVCDDGFFDGSAADVVCKQLGYTRGSRYSSSIVGSSSQPIWLDDVVCGSSWYNCLGNCQVCPTISNNDCGHHEDVSIRCAHSFEGGEPSTTTDTCVGASVPLTSPEATIGIAVAGAVVGITVLVVFILIVIFIHVRCKKARQRSTGDNVNMTALPSSGKTAVVLSTASKKKTEPIPSKTSTFTSDPPPPYPASEFKQAHPPVYPGKS